jgi:hypothetical protein
MTECVGALVVAEQPLGERARRCIARRKRSISTRSVPIPTMFMVRSARAYRSAST